LGFEDMEQFKNICSDVADLFVKKPGFIFKFKNFSWIDYTLNSGAPKKSVVLKLKDGNELETGIKIKEILLYDKQNQEKIYYSIYFTNEIAQTIRNPVDPILEETNLLSTAIEPIQEQQDVSIDFANEIDRLEKNEVKEEDPDISTDFNEQTIDEKPILKLKIDNEILETKDTEKLFAEDDYKPDTQKISAQNDEEVKIETEVIISNIQLKEERRITNVPLVENLDEYIPPFDLAECTEALGLDISLVAEVISDYMRKIDETIPRIKNCIDLNDEISLQSNLLNLKGVSDNLHIKNLSKQLENTIKERRKDYRKEKIEQFEKMVQEFKKNIL
jgi:hypothetical protein